MCHHFRMRKLHKRHVKPGAGDMRCTCSPWLQEISPCVHIFTSSLFLWAVPQTSLFSVMRVSSQDGLFNLCQSSNPFSTRSSPHCYSSNSTLIFLPTLPGEALFSRTEQACYGSAYTSGIGKDLDFVGMDYNDMDTVYQFIYLIYQMPRTP